MIQSNSFCQKDRLSPFWALSAPSSAGFFLPLNQLITGATTRSMRAWPGFRIQLRSFLQKAGESPFLALSAPSSPGFFLPLNQLTTGVTTRSMRA